MRFLEFCGRFVSSLYPYFDLDQPAADSRWEMHTCGKVHHTKRADLQVQNQPSLVDQGGLWLTPVLLFSSTLNSVIVNGSCLTQLTLKRNIPNNMFLNEIGRNCPCLQELDIAGAEVFVIIQYLDLTKFSRLWQTLGLCACFMLILSRSSSNVGTEKEQWGSRKGLQII